MTTEVKMVKMKTVRVSWSQRLYYITTLEVPEEATEKEIEEIFWKMDLSGEKVVDADYTEIDNIYRTRD